MSFDVFTVAEEVDTVDKLISHLAINRNVQKFRQIIQQIHQIPNHKLNVSRLERSKEKNQRKCKEMIKKSFKNL